MSGGDSTFIKEMVELFREQVGEYASMMPDLLSKKKYLDLSKLAHKAKSSVAVMGMRDVAALLKELEILASEGKEVERYASMVGEFIEKSHAAVVELEKAIQ
jgi:HPt (histidine-containing phosphotransfer) domain-containing protein